jgi:hypothetical protein
VTTTIDESPGDLRERLEHEADAARERLMSRLDRLTERRDRVGHWLEALATEAQRHRSALIGVGAAGIGVFGLLLLRRRARLPSCWPASRSDTDDGPQRVPLARHGTCSSQPQEK